jgi:hypothetical protein
MKVLRVLAAQVREEASGLDTLDGAGPAYDDVATA